VVQSYDTKDACQKAVTIKRSTVNAMVHKGEAAYEVFTCFARGRRPGSRPLRVNPRRRQTRERGVKNLSG